MFKRSNKIDNVVSQEFFFKSSNVFIEVFNISSIFLLSLSFVFADFIEGGGGKEDNLLSSQSIYNKNIFYNTILFII